MVYLSITSVPSGHLVQAFENSLSLVFIVPTVVTGRILMAFLESQGMTGISTWASIKDALFYLIMMSKDYPGTPAHVRLNVLGS